MKTSTIVNHGVSKPFFYRPGFVLFVIVLALINNLEHSTQVYYQISRPLFNEVWANWILCTLVNLLIDLAVIAFVVNGRHKEAGLYAFFIFIINLLYYDGLGVFSMEVNHKIANLTYSIMFTYSIYTFSKLYVETINSNEKKHIEEISIEAVNEKMLVANKTIGTLHESISTHEESIQFLKNEKHDRDELVKGLNAFKEKRVKELTCPDCGFVAENDYGVSGHRKGCKAKR